MGKMRKEVRRQNPNPAEAPNYAQNFKIHSFILGGLQKDRQTKKKKGRQAHTHTQTVWSHGREGPEVFPSFIAKHATDRTLVIHKPRKRPVTCKTTGIRYR